MDKVRHPQVIRTWKVERTKILNPRQAMPHGHGPVTRKTPKHGK